jgi:hypothetical protein
MGGMVGGVLSDIFGGQAKTQAANAGTENAFRGRLAGQMASDPHRIAKSAASGDIGKSFLGDIGAEMIDQKTYDQLGSSNENLLGINKTIDDFVGQAGFKEIKGQPWWKKILSAAVPTALSAVTGGLFGGGK